VKRRLVDPNETQFSILAIAEHAGFTSKSAFNSVFKRLVGMTPSEWRKQATSEPKVE
jgi:AraC-like DNA-binding protein